MSSNPLRLGAVAVVVVAVLLAIVLGGGGSSSTQTTLTAGGATAGAPNAPPFNVKLPSSWQAVPAGGLASYPGRPVAVLLRQGHTGLITVTQARSNRHLALGTLGPTLAKKISGRFADAKTVDTRLVKVPAGRAFYYAFVRTKAGTVNALLIVPAGSVSYELNSVVPGNQPQAAKEVGQIFQSFSLS